MKELLFIVRTADKYELVDLVSDDVKEVAKFLKSTVSTVLEATREKSIIHGYRVSREFVWHTV